MPLLASTSCRLWKRRRNLETSSGVVEFLPPSIHPILNIKYFNKDGEKIQLQPWKICFHILFPSPHLVGDRKGIQQPKTCSNIYGCLMVTGPLVLSPRLFVYPGAPWGKSLALDQGGRKLCLWIIIIINCFSKNVSNAASSSQNKVKLWIKLWKNYY